MKILLYVDPSWKNYKLFEFVLNDYFPKWHWWFRKLEFLFAGKLEFCNKFFEKKKARYGYNGDKFDLKEEVFVSNLPIDKALIFCKNEKSLLKRENKKLISFLDENKYKYSTFFSEDVTYVQKNTK